MKLSTGRNPLYRNPSKTPVKKPLWINGAFWHWRLSNKHMILVQGYDTVLTAGSLAMFAAIRRAYAGCTQGAATNRSAV